MDPVDVPPIPPGLAAKLDQFASLTRQAVRSQAETAKSLLIFATHAEELAAELRSFERDQEAAAARSTWPAEGFSTPN